MSPFAQALRQLRYLGGLRQQELADLIGCERSYISALENDIKQAPPEAFVEALCKVLALTDHDAAMLRRARQKSRRHYSVPADASTQAYELAHELFTRLDRLNTLQIQGLMAILQLGDMTAGPVPTEGRIRRKDRRPQREEDTM